MPVADIDFTGTEGAGRLKDGTYRARLEKVEQKDGREYPLWVWTFTSMEPETAGQQSQHTTSLSPKAARFIRQVLTALGGDVPSSLARVNTDVYLGCQAMIYVIQDGTFTGRDGQEYPKYKIDRVFPVGNGSAAQAPAQMPSGVSERDAVQFSSDSDDIPFD